MGSFFSAARVSSRIFRILSLQGLGFRKCQIHVGFGVRVLGISVIMDCFCGLLRCRRRSGYGGVAAGHL